ncbi:hypothetical protein ACOACO_18390 [Nocardioides sp. CPCC 205120]|uniref:hypothetical protein n=1 Tax=Nocardioides sp. CPCC 205120 TaxID=3406462 RepID=UPI003B50F7DE
MITGTVVLDLAAAKPERRRHCVAGLVEAPDGVRVVLRVGRLMPQPSLTWHVAAHEHRLVVDVEGEVAAVREWLAAVREHVAEVRP